MGGRAGSVFGFFFARCGSPPADSESQNLAFSYTPSNLPSSGKLLPPGREIRFGSAGSLRNPHASDLKGRGERKEKACDKCEKNSAGGSPPRDGAFWELRAGLQHPNLHDFTSKPPCALRHPRAPAAPSPPSPKPAPQLCPFLSHRLLHLHTHTRIALAGLDFKRRGAKSPFSSPGGWFSLGRFLSQPQGKQPMSF